MAIEVVDTRLNNGDFPELCGCLLEATLYGDAMSSQALDHLRSSGLKVVLLLPAMNESMVQVLWNARNLHIAQEQNEGDGCKVVAPPK